MKLIGIYLLSMVVLTIYSLAAIAVVAATVNFLSPWWLIVEIPVLLVGGSLLTILGAEWFANTQ